MSKIIVIVIIFVSLFEAVQAQKGEESISAGPVLVFPMSTFDNVATGIGLEVDGQYSFTDKSSALIQLQLTRFARIYNYYYNGFDHGAHIYLSLKGGYSIKLAIPDFTQILS